MTILDSVVNSQPTLAQQLCAGAVTHLHGARALANSKGAPVGISFALLVGVSLEAALKAYICANDSTFVPKKLGHDIDQLWMRAVGHGLKAPRSAWVEDIVRLHGGPDHLARYMGEGNGLLGTTFTPTISELSKVVEEMYAVVYPGSSMP